MFTLVYSERQLSESIFFSWQSDTHKREGKYFIEKALKSAVDQLNADAQITEAERQDYHIDKDTNNVPGQPPIVETIFKKIDCAKIFIPDLTFVGKRSDGRPTPNPNVLIEYGWALKSLGHERIVAVMNTAHGNPDENSMPFDMRHLRYPLQYHLESGADVTVRKQARDDLTKKLKNALGLVLNNTKPESQKVKESDLFEPLEPEYSNIGEFRGLINCGLGLVDAHNSMKEYVLQPNREVIWLRVMPVLKLKNNLSNSMLRSLLRELKLGLIFSDRYSDVDFIRSADGNGIVSASQNHITNAVTFVFKTGEIWSIDKFPCYDEGLNLKVLPSIEKEYESALSNFTQFLERSLGAARPHKWIAGIAGIKGAQLEFGRHWGRIGPCDTDWIIKSGTIKSGESSRESLLPFFEDLIERFGGERSKLIGSAISQ
jgi:hypothetical protein